MEKRLYLECYILVLQRFDGLRVDDGGAVESQFDGFRIADVRNLHCLLETLWVGVEQPIDVFPDGDFLGVKAVGEDGGGIVGTFASKGGGVFAVGSAADEALGDAHDAADVLVVEFLYFQPRLVPVGVGGAETVVGQHVFAGVEPAGRHVAVVEVFLYDGGGKQFSVAHRLVVLVVVVEVRLGEFLVEFDEEIRHRLDDGVVLPVVEQVEDDFLVVFHHFCQGLETEVAVVLAEVGKNLFEHVGGLSHGRHHEEYVFVLVLLGDSGEVAHGVGIFHRSAAEFIDFLYHFLGY